MFLKLLLHDKARNNINNEGFMRDFILLNSKFSSPSILSNTFYMFLFVIHSLHALTDYTRLQKKKKYELYKSDIRQSKYDIQITPTLTIFMRKGFKIKENNEGLLYLYTILGKIKNV